jgi:hypothetical protein
MTWNYFATHKLIVSDSYLIINMNTQDLPFNWNPTGSQVCPAVLTCNLETSFHAYIISSGKHILHASIYLLYLETYASYLHYSYKRIHESLISFQSLRKSSDFIAISLHLITSELMGSSYSLT